MSSNLTDKERVGRALDLLKIALGRFIDGEFQRCFNEQGHSRAQQFMRERRFHKPSDESTIEQPLTEWDVAALVPLMDASWNEVFRPKLGKAGKIFRSRVLEINEIRHQWAHQSSIPKLEADHAVVAVLLVLKSMAAPEATQAEDLLVDSPGTTDAPGGPPSPQVTMSESAGQVRTDLLPHDEFQHLQERSLELSRVLGRGAVVLRLWLLAWLVGVAGIVLGGRSLVLHGASLWLVIPGSILGALLAFVVVAAAASRVSKGLLASLLSARAEQKKIVARLARHEKEQLRREEEELPDIPVTEHLLAGMAKAETQDVFANLAMLSAATNPKTTMMFKLLIQEKFYPILLRQALTWWCEERDDVDEYVRAHWEEILADEDKIIEEFGSDLNMTVDMGNCRRIATWAVRNKLDEVRHHIPDLARATEPISPQHPAVEQLAQILRTWGGHKYRILLPKARAYAAVSEDAVKPPVPKLSLMAARLERTAKDATAQGIQRARVTSMLQSEIGIIVQELRGAGTSEEDIRLLSVGLNRKVDLILRNYEPRETPGA